MIEDQIAGSGGHGVEHTTPSVTASSSRTASNTRQPVPVQPGHPDQVPYERRPRVPDQSRRQTERTVTNENRQTYRQASMSGKDTLLPSDNTVSAYWITNPDNTFVDNVAAGSDENGFWFSLPEHPQRRVPGHGRRQEHLATPHQVPRNSGATLPTPTSTGSCSTGTSMRKTSSGWPAPRTCPRKTPPTTNSKSVDALFENLTAYKNRNGGVWSRGERHVFRNFKTADNAIGFTMSTGSFGDDMYTSLVIDSLFVGETDNIGNPVTPEEKAYGRSLPKRADSRLPDPRLRVLRLPPRRGEHDLREFPGQQTARSRSAFMAVVYGRRGYHRKHRQGCEVRQCQARVLPEDRHPVRQ